MQRPLDRNRVCGVACEHLGPGVVWRPARYCRQRLGVLPQVKRVLQDIEREGAVRQAAVGQPGEERVDQDGAVDVADALPQLAGEAATHGVAPRARPLSALMTAPSNYARRRRVPQIRVRSASRSVQRVPGTDGTDRTGSVNHLRFTDAAVGVTAAAGDAEALSPA